jgi:protein-L-isoaspartate(D-aspartate) O-methyltransferase
MSQPTKQDSGEEATARSRRETMVLHQLTARNVRDSRVLAAMSTLPRHLFVPSKQALWAYDDRALPIGFGQTISQPYIVALMLEMLVLNGTERVLHVGTGSGYQAALLAMLAREVYSVEIVPALTSRARNTIEQLGFKNVKVVQGNGSIGLPAAAPFDAIVVAAGAPEVPASLLSQLTDEGTLVIPVGGRADQQLLRTRKHAGKISIEEIAPCVFVPLVGEQGWQS